MRTTITLADDVAAAVERVRHERNIGVSEAVNDLVRRGLMKEPRRQKFVQRSRDVGLRIDVRNVAEAIETLEGPTAR